MSGRRGAAALLLSLMLGACGYQGSNEVREITQDQMFGLDQTTTSTTSTTTTTTTPPVTSEAPPDRTTTTSASVQPSTTVVVTEVVELYFLDGAQLTSSSRNLSSPTSLFRVLDALEAGPPPGEAGLGLRSAVPRGLVNSATREAGVANVDLVGEVYERIEPDAELPAIAQIVLTVTNQPGVGQVRFTLDGEPLIVRLGNNLVTLPGAPVSADDYANLLTSDVPTSVPTTTTTTSTVASTPPPSVPPTPPPATT